MALQRIAGQFFVSKSIVNKTLKSPAFVGSGLLFVFASSVVPTHSFTLDSVAGFCHSFERRSLGSEVILISRQPPATAGGTDYGPKRRRYSSEVMNAFTISALTKLPLNAFNFASQKS